MIILTLKTDSSVAQIALFEDEKQLQSIEWDAPRQLADTIHQKLEELLKASDKKLKDVEGIVCFKGPGSFTGLRIGLSVANALAQGLSVPVVATNDEDWQKTGIKNIKLGHNDHVALPEYGALPNITKPKK